MNYNYTFEALIIRTIEFYYPDFHRSVKFDKSMRQQTVDPVFSIIWSSNIEEKLKNSVLKAFETQHCKLIELNTTHNRLATFIAQYFNNYVKELERTLSSTPLKFMVQKALLAQYITDYADYIQYNLIKSYFEHFYSQAETISSSKEYLKRIARLKRLVQGNETITVEPREKVSKSNKNNKLTKDDLNYLNDLTEEDIEKELLSHIEKDTSRNNLETILKKVAKV